MDKIRLHGRDAARRVLFQVPERGCPGHVVLNWSRDPIGDLERISESYQEVARCRVQFLKSLDRIYPPHEFEAYPIAFMYRQAFELSLKANVYAGAVLLRDEGEEPTPISRIMTHDLKTLFQEVARVFDKWAAGDPGVWDFDEPKLKTKSDFAKIVHEFQEVDPGYTFRYSVKKDGSTPSLDEGFEFDLFAFSATMDSIITLLNVRPEMIRDEMQERWRAAYEAQQEEWANADYDPRDYDPDPY